MTIFSIMAKLVLSNLAMQESFLEDSAMLGIASAAPAYHLCWLLNRHFDFNFVRDADTLLSTEKKDDPNKYYYPLYKYNLPNSSQRYLLYKLKNGSESLLPEIRRMDYLWLIQTASPEKDVTRITREIRNIPDIQLAQVLVQEQLKNVKNLII